MPRVLLATALTTGLFAFHAFAADQAQFNYEPTKAQAAIVKLEHADNVKSGAYKAADIGIYEIDLNKDGTNEIIAYSNTSFWCGSAGCDIGVYTKKNGKWTRIMDVSGDETIGVGDKSSNGFRDIYLKNAQTGAPVRWAFNGKKYVLND